MNESVKPQVSLYSEYIKRVFDFFICIIALLFLSPLFLVIALLEMKYHGHPVIFSQERPGKDEKIFKMYKFRSMTNEMDEGGNLLPDAERLTSFGKFLRKWSLDELPELINIVKGDMSIIGPRPLLVRYLDFYGPRYKMRHFVRPGLACLRIDDEKEGSDGAWTWREQFECDIYYVENVSFLLDIKMLFAIVKEVFRHSEYRVEALGTAFTGDNLDSPRSRREKRGESV